MGFAQWLRGNSEFYLLEAAQRDMARRYGRPPPAAARGGFAAFFWRRIFVPLYGLLPWGLRRFVMRLLPGSHRRQWRGRAPPEVRGS